MRTALLLLAAPLLAVPAHASEGEGTILVQKQGLFPAYAWVDGQPVGKIKKRKPREVSVSAGWHEVWYAADSDGVVTLCHGLVRVENGGTATPLYRDRGCEGLSDGWPDGPSAFKGAEVRFRVDGDLDAWVSIDGSQPFAFPDMPFSLNLAPGPHTFVLYDDVMDANVIDQGTVTLGPGEMIPVTCTVAGCVGFDQPPVFIVELREAPAIQIATPGVSIDVNIGAGPTGAGMSVDVDDGQGGGAGVRMDVGVDDGQGGGAGMRMDVEVDESESSGGVRMDVQVDDGMGGGASLEMDVEVEE